MTGIPAAVQLVLLPFFPESPRYLLIQKKDAAAAKKGEARLREEGGGQGRSRRATLGRPPAPLPQR